MSTGVAVVIHSSGDGTTALGWPDQGARICTAPRDQVLPVAIPDEEQGLTLCWQDHRSGSPDIYAIQLDSNGARRPGWPEGGAQVCQAPTLSRQTPVMIRSGANGVIAVWQEDRCGGWDIYAKRVPLSGLVVDVEAAEPLAPRSGLLGAMPNPARGVVRAAFSLADLRPAALELFDLAGRRVLSREVGPLGGGQHFVSLSPSPPLAPGLYVLRLRAGGATHSRRVIVTR